MSAQVRDPWRLDRQLGTVVELTARERRELRRIWGPANIHFWLAVRWSEEPARVLVRHAGSVEPVR